MQFNSSLENFIRPRLHYSRLTEHLGISELFEKSEAIAQNPWSGSLFRQIEDRAKFLPRGDEAGLKLKENTEEGRVKEG